MKPSLIASSISLNLSVIPGTREDAYLIILEITSQAYSPYLSFRLIKLLISTVSTPKSIFFEVVYSPVSKLIASNTFWFPLLFIL